MANLYFDPRYRLSIGGQTYDSDNHRAYKDLTEIQDTFIFENTQLTFKIEKSTTPSANTADITIFNPPKRFIQNLKNVQGRKPSIKLELGYKDVPLGVVFLGAVDNMKEIKEGIDNKVRLVCSEGSLNMKESVSIRSYPAGTEINTILTDLNSDLQTVEGFIFDTGETIRTPFAVNGNTYKAIEKVCNRYGLETNIQAGLLYILPPDMIINTKIKTKLSPETGLIGSPVLKDNSTIMFGDKTSTKSGIRLKALINSGVMPNSFIEVESEDYNGIFKVEKVRFIGDFEGSTWEMEIECAVTEFEEVLEGSPQSISFTDPTIDVFRHEGG